MSPQPIPGRATVSRQALIDVIRAAVLGSYGVTGFADPTFGARLARWLRVDEPGIRLQLGGALRLDLFLTVAYGLPVAEVARQVDSAVRYAVRRATRREFAALTIHVDGLRVLPGGPPPASDPAPPVDRGAAPPTPGRRRFRSGSPSA
jgi:uncharacterized alkaline shock family protein YloU